MISKSEIQFIQSLQQKKIRQREQLFLLEGTKIVGEVLASDFKLHSFYALSGWIEKNKALLIGKNCKEISTEELGKISCLTTPNEVLVVAHIPQKQLDFANLKTNLSIALDNIQDPGNFGTLIRIADWFGISSILCSENTVDCYNPKVIQASMGSFLRTSVFYGNIADALQFALENKIPTYAAVLGGDNLYKKELTQNGIIVFGNESKGISEEISKLVDCQLSIPSFSINTADSLNVSIAAAIFCSEFKRNKG